jgi:hypothetical protein
MCKKNDGRNWFCKQRAKLPHKLCEHRLRLSRSCKEPSGSGVGSKTKKHKETRNFNSEYYYYRTVVPPGGKRRHNGNADDGTNDKHVGEKMEIINVPDGDEEDEVQMLDYKIVSGSNDEEKLKTGAKKARKLVKYRSLDSLAGGSGGA